MATLPTQMQLDCTEETKHIAQFIKSSLQHLKRRGLIVAVSGGIDSAVCLALAVEAIGKDRVLALLLPEKQSSSSSTSLAITLCEQLGVEYLIEDISPALNALGCYEKQAEAIRTIDPDFEDGTPFKLVLSNEARISTYHAVIEKDKKQHSVRCPAEVFRQVIAATNHKQRIRKSLEYYHAERTHYAVIGTPNLLEFELGFFVKSGDGVADIKPIAHLYKSQVFQLAAHLNIPSDIQSAKPTTDTFSLEQSQEEFFYQAPHTVMDIILWAQKEKLELSEIAKLINATEEETLILVNQTKATQTATLYQRSEALTIK